MRSWLKVLAAAALICASAEGFGAGISCTMQAELSPADRDAISAAGARIASAIAGQDLTGLKAALLPAEASAWDSISATVTQGQALVQGGQITIRDAFLLDATSQQAPADTQFFCSNASGSLTVTIMMRALPPGRYAVVLADVVGSPLAGQLGIILAWDQASSSWMLAGLTLRPGALDGHDGVWYWKRARDLAADDPWSAIYMYDTAHYLLLPVDFMSSPNLEKLQQEQSQITPDPRKALPLSIPDGDRTWKIVAVSLDASLREPDLAVAYQSTGVTDPAALRTEATTVLSAFLKTEPGIRANFHGLWAYAVNGDKRTPVMELPMKQIP
ncbi:MAG: hypothetical protein ABR928_22990 [Terracidiphilus sp.]|jgi:hypothetical protein